MFPRLGSTHSGRSCAPPLHPVGVCFADDYSDADRRRVTERRRLNEGPTFQIVKVIYELEALAAQLRLLGCYGGCQDRYAFSTGRQRSPVDLWNTNPRWRLFNSVPTKIR